MLLQLDSQDENLPLSIFLIILGKDLYNNEGDLNAVDDDILIHLHNLLVNELEARQGTKH
mgnify:CR=1 FL=1|tara:strand:+ start:12266 stop:12445 length:180 start_codon:yes stop_codon:yes gene_type:complete